MKKFVLFFIFTYSVIASISAANVSEKDRFLSELKSGIQEVSAMLPMSQQQGAWFWSASMEGSTIKYVFKYSDAFLKQFGSEDQAKAIFENMANNFPNTILEAYTEQEKQLFAKYITFTYEIYSFDTNKLLFTKTLKPSQIKQMLDNSKCDGNRPLSYYKNGFESDKINLPLTVYEYLIYNDINMDGSKVIFEFYIDEKMADKDIYSKIKNLFLEKYRNSTLEMKQDYITYNIKFYYRFYSMSNKNKLIKEVIIDPAKDF